MKPSVWRIVKPCLLLAAALLALATLLLKSYIPAYLAVFCLAFAGLGRFSFWRCPECGRLLPRGTDNAVADILLAREFWSCPYCDSILD